MHQEHRNTQLWLKTFQSFSIIQNVCFLNWFLTKGYQEITQELRKVETWSSFWGVALAPTLAAKMGDGDRWEESRNVIWKAEKWKKGLQYNGCRIEEEVAGEE